MLKILREILSFTRSFMINTRPLVGCLENSDRKVKQFRVILRITSSRLVYSSSIQFPKGLFTWKEGAPANRATRLEGLKHSPPLHATHLTGTVSGLRELSLERPLSTTNVTADQGNFFPSYVRFLHEHGPVLCLRLVYYIDLFRLTVILFGR